MIRVLVAAPALALRAGLRALLADDTGIEVVAEAAWLDDLSHLPGEPDVLVLVEAAFAAGKDSEDHLEALLHTGEPAAALLLFAESAADGAGESAGLAGLLPRLGARAWGVLPLDCSAEELQIAVRALHQGLLVGSPELLHPLLTPFSEQGELLGAHPLEPLTERELQVLQLLAQGLANKQIAAALSISEHTVKFHVSGVYAKLGAASRTEAVRLGVRQGLIVL